MSETGCDSISEGNIEVLSLYKGTITNIKRDGGISTQTVEFELPALTGGAAATVNSGAINWPHKTYIKDMIIIPSVPIVTASGAGQHLRVQAGTAAGGQELVVQAEVVEGAGLRPADQWGRAGAPAHLNVPLYILRDGVGPGVVNSFARASGGSVGGPNFSSIIRPGPHAALQEDGTGEEIHVRIGTSLLNTLAGAHAAITFKVIITFSE
jgi:hypothetical protein